MTQQSWTTKTIGEVGEEINKEETCDIFCICEEQPTIDTIEEYCYCTKCPEDTDERIYYCNDCISFCKKKHKRRNHEPELKYLSKTDTNVMKDHSSKLLTKYNDYRVQKELDIVTKATNVVCKFGKTLSRLTDLGVESFIAYQAVFVSAGSKTAIKVSSKMGMDMSKEILRNTLHGAAGLQALYCAVEIGSACALWYKGGISGKELIRRCGKSVIGNTAAFAGGYLGFKVGAAIGTWFGPGIGTIVGGIIGTVIGSLTSQFVCEEVFEKYFPQEKKLDPKKELKLALDWFHFEEKDMKNPDKWNEKNITKIYRQLAKLHHPDRNKGDAGKFIATTKHFGVLLGELDSKRKGNKNKSKQRTREITF